MNRKKIQPTDHVPVTITPRQRDFITEHTFAEPDLMEPLRLAEAKGGKLVVKFTLDDLEELRGHVAAEANHADDKKLQKELDALFQLITATMEQYDDGQWQNEF